MEEPIKAILTDSKTIAVVGLSTQRTQASYMVACYLLDHGYEVIPVNPTATEILGRKSYASLSDLPAPPDVVDIFRRSEFVPKVVEEAIAIGAKAIWMQLGVEHPSAADLARQAGLKVVMNHCMKREHQRMSGKPITRTYDCRR